MSRAVDALDAAGNAPVTASRLQRIDGNRAHGGSVNGAFGIDVALTALEREGKVKILSTPRVTTQNSGNGGSILFPSDTTSRR